jgi:sugar lactone lactonase YvrE
VQAKPNDLAIAADGTLYASDPDKDKKHLSGRIWRITRGLNGKGRGEVMSGRKMSTTNGIDLSPDGKTLYVGESATRELWAYRVDGAKLVTRGLVTKFEDFDLDGLRTDIDGQIYVTRNGKGTVAVISPDGTVKREIPLLGKEPTNLAFGGPDGKTVFVTQSEGGFIEAFRVERPGREYCQMPDRSC